MGKMRSPARQSSGVRWCAVETAWGWCGLRRGEDGISRCSLPSPDRSSASLSVAGAFMRDGAVEAPDDPLLASASRLLVAYFDGRPMTFDLTVSTEGTTDFASRVLRACARIPWGETRSYGQIARAAGSPRGARAAGQALGGNPVPIIVPCHRVIGADGRLTGFGSGIGMKRRLLELEGIDVSQ